MIIYDNSPLAEYFKSFESQEEFVPLTEEHEEQKTETKISSLWNRVIAWYQHFKIQRTPPPSTFLTLEKQFDSQLRNLIYASPLLDDRVPQYFVREEEEEEEGSEIIQANETKKHFVAFTATAGTILSFLKPCRNVIFFMVLGAGFWCWKSREKVPMDISVLRNSVLERTRELIRESNRLDSKINRIVKQIQEVELVSRGYRLSNPLPPISRIEQLDTSRRRSRHLRTCLFQILTTASSSFEQYRNEISPNHHPIHFDPPQIEDDTAIETLKFRFEELHTRRRTCLETLLEENSRRIQLLATRVYARNDTGVVGSETEFLFWTAKVKSIVTEMKGIVKAASTGLEEIIRQDDDSLKKNSSMDSSAVASSGESSSSVVSQRNNPIVHRLAVLDRLLRTARVRVRICAEVVTECGVVEEEWRRLGDEMKEMVEVWEESTVSEDPEPSIRNVPWRAMEEDEEKSVAVNRYDSRENVEEVEEGKEDVFEGVAGAVEGNKKQLSRSERITESKRKRQEEAQARVQREIARSTSEKMVSELKDVLAVRKGTTL